MGIVFIFIYVISFTLLLMKTWFEKIDLLKQSFHQVLNSNFSQMFSFIKAIDICDQSISFTFYGNNEATKEIKSNLLKDFLGRASFIYKEQHQTDGNMVICVNQTCSNKMTSIGEINKYLAENKIS